MNANLWRPEITVDMIHVGGNVGRLLFAVSGVTAVLRGVPAAWYFLVLFFAVAIVGGLGFAASLQHLYRLKEGVINENRWLEIKVPRIGIGDGFLCLLFVAACIWAFVFGGDWFRYFFIAAVAGGLVVAATMYVGRRAAR